MSEDRFDEFLGPYLLHQLTAEEEHELEHHLEGCPKCRDELERARQTHALLGELAANEPPPELKDRVLARAKGQASARFGSGWKLWVPVAAALLVAGFLGIALIAAITGGSSSGVPLTATALAPGASGELRGEKVGENLRVELEVEGLPELRKHEYYEMWYATEDGERISCGTFRAQPEGRTIVNLTAPALATSYPVIEVTREPDDGDPATSGKKILVGDLRNL
jgi:anti-sigma-K factor RskA